MKIPWNSFEHVISFVTTKYQSKYSVKQSFSNVLHSDGWNSLKFFVGSNNNSFPIARMRNWCHWTSDNYIFLVGNCWCPRRKTVWIVGKCEKSTDIVNDMSSYDTVVSIQNPKLDHDDHHRLVVRQEFRLIVIPILHHDAAILGMISTCAAGVSESKK